VLLIGLTGGIASGKTLVSNAFAEKGVPVIDADVLAREVVQPGSHGLNQLVASFGRSILNTSESLDRATLRELIFTNAEHRKTVDSILHPLIRQRSDERISAAAAAGHLYAIYAVPLLVETGQTERFNRIVVVDVPEALQLSRLLTRDGSDENTAKKILNAQASREERLAVADDVIDNSGSVTDTLSRVTELHQHYLVLASNYDNPH